MRVLVNINNIDTVKKFVNTVSKLDDVELDLVSGRYVIDAKSIMGIFSIDISKPVKLEIHAQKAGRAEEVIKILKEFIVNEEEL